MCGVFVAISSVNFPKKPEKNVILLVSRLCVLYTQTLLRLYPITVFIYPFSPCSFFFFSYIHLLEHTKTIFVGIAKRNVGLAFYFSSI